MVHDDEKGLGIIVHMQCLNQGDCECYVYESLSPHVLVVIALAGRKGHSRILSSLRHRVGDQVSKDDFVWSAIKQATNLKKKLAILDCLHLSEINFSQVFCAARVLIGTEPDIMVERAWVYAEECLKHLESQLTIHFLLPPDYNQKFHHRLRGSVLDGLELKSLHDPSAVGTVLCFEIVLGGCELPLPFSSIGIIGIGELGSRIVDLLLQKSVRSLSLYDIDDNRTARFQGDGRISLAGSLIATFSNVNAVICSAHSGSLTGGLASTLSGDNNIFAIGGPEAGLDHGIDAVRRLTSCGKHFIPSLFCGSMGLAANLEELLTGQWNMKRIEHGLEIVVRQIMDCALRRGQLFHEEAERQIGAWLSDI